MIWCGIGWGWGGVRWSRVACRARAIQIAGACAVLCCAVHAVAVCCIATRYMPHTTCLLLATLATYHKLATCCSLFATSCFLRTASCVSASIDCLPFLLPKCHFATCCSPSAALLHCCLLFYSLLAICCEGGWCSRLRRGCSTANGLPHGRLSARLRSLRNRHPPN